MGSTVNRELEEDAMYVKRHFYIVEPQSNFRKVRGRGRRSRSQGAACCFETSVCEVGKVLAAPQGGQHAS